MLRTSAVKRELFGVPSDLSQLRDDIPSLSAVAPTGTQTTAVTLEVLQGLLEQQTQAIMAATQEQSENLAANCANICH